MCDSTTIAVRAAQTSPGADVLTVFVNLEFSIFLHEYDLKHRRIFTAVLEVDKKNANKQMRQSDRVMVTLMFTSFKHKLHFLHKNF